MGFYFKLGKKEKKKRKKILQVFWRTVILGFIFITCGSHVPNDKSLTWET